MAKKIGRLISSLTAYNIASMWGSYMHTGDPGACFYGFLSGDGRPQDSSHRHQCLKYIETLKEDTGKGKLTKRDLAELNRLERWFLYGPDINGEFEHK